MKIGISADGKNLEDRVSEVFARCHYFIIAEIENGKIKSFEEIENETKLGGVGISAAKLMAEKDVKAVITKNIGPRTFDLLRQFNIEVYQGEGKVKKVIEEFIQGKLEKFE
jgi:predicted Fe-Mo cluster-binding NifX family protein